VVVVVDEKTRERTNWGLADLFPFTTIIPQDKKPWISTS
jgi:hypothetical protein